MNPTLIVSNLHSLPLLARGKVRDNYAVGTDRMLILASDRISAFDVVLNEPIPGKGVLLTRMASFWFRKLQDIVPTHLLEQDPLAFVAADEADQVRGRSMLVQRLTPLPIEAVVRGYLAGSGWEEYHRTGSVCGLPQPAGLLEGSQLPKPIFTPARKAAAGEHDENINFDQLERLIGVGLASRVKTISLRLYEHAAKYAIARGIIIADSKFEFGVDSYGTLTLMDEALTPDSSRFWPAGSHVPGTKPLSYDKQGVRDWLSSARTEGGLWNKRAPAPPLPRHVVLTTAARYTEACALLLGENPV